LQLRELSSAGWQVCPRPLDRRLSFQQWAGGDAPHYRGRLGPGARPSDGCALKMTNPSDSGATGLMRRSEEDVREFFDQTGRYLTGNFIIRSRWIGVERLIGDLRN